MEAGRPTVLGPPGGGSAGPPKSFGPTPSGKPEVKPAPAAAKPEPPKPAAAKPEPPKPEPTKPEPAKPEAKKQEATKPVPAAANASAVPTSSTASASADSCSSGASTAKPLAVGTYARIAGLKAAPQLNGKLCQVVRPGDTPDRTVVRTSGGAEKALKHASLETGAVVYPKHLGKVAGVLLILTLLVVGDVCRTRGRNALSAAALPFVGTVCLAATLGFCVSVWWSCRPTSTWFPSVSELGANAPIRNVYRVGFLVFAVFFAMTNGLYQEILLPSIEIPAPLDEAALLEIHAAFAALHAPAPGPALDAENVSEVAAAPDVSTTAAEDDGATPVAEEDNVAAGTTENVTETTNTTSEPKRNNTNDMLILGTDRSLAWGYAAAAGIGVQAVFSFDGKLSVSSVLHSAGMLLFAIGVFQHAMQTTFWLTLPYGRSLVGAPGWLGTVFKFRRSITEYGPLALMLGPLSSQFWTTAQRANLGRNRYQARYDMKGIFEDTGMPKSISMMSWALVVLIVVFYGSFAFDLWYANEHSVAAALSEQEL